MLFAILTLTSVMANSNENITKNKLELSSISALEFSPEGTLFIGDSIQGEIFAVQMNETKASKDLTPPSIDDLEGKIAALIGAKTSDVLIHDLAVHPISKNVYLAISTGRANWNNRWHTPNMLANASVLVRIKPNNTIEAVDIETFTFTSTKISNPIGIKKQYPQKGPRAGVSRRVNAITELAYKNHKLYVAGLSNEEFASSMWTFSYPFTDHKTATTLEIFHGAHNRNETHAPVRTFLPYTLNGKEQLLAAYLCTPIVTIDIDLLNDTKHVIGKTIGEIGSANIPIDMVAYKHNGQDKILMSNTQMPLMTFNVKDIESIKKSLSTADDVYNLGLKYEAMPRGGIQQIDDFNDKYVISTKRMGGGSLSLWALKKSWLY